MMTGQGIVMRMLMVRLSQLMVSIVMVWLSLVILVVLLRSGLIVGVVMHLSLYRMVLWLQVLVRSVNLI